MRKCSTGHPLRSALSNAPSAPALPLLQRAAKVGPLLWHSLPTHYNPLWALSAADARAGGTFAVVAVTSFGCHPEAQGLRVGPGRYPRLPLTIHPRQPRPRAPAPGPARSPSRTLFPSPKSQDGGSRIHPVLPANCSHTDSQRLLVSREAQTTARDSQMWHRHARAPWALLLGV